MTRSSGKRWLRTLALFLLLLAAAWFTDCSPALFWARRSHLTDLISAMLPPDWGYAPRILAPLLATVQMSVTGTALGSFLALLLAVLEKRGNLKVSQCDAYLNIIGGLTLEEPAADLSAVVAIASSYLDKPVPSQMAAIGEVGLSGEIRSINHMEQRLSEVQRLGFTQCIVPEHRVKEMKELPHLELLPVQNVAQALQLLVQGKLMK